MKIVVLDGYTENPGDLSWDEVIGLAKEVEIYDRTEEELILERASGAQILLTNKTPLTEDTLKKLPSLKYIGVLATGYNVVDVAAAKELGIIVTNIPTYGTDSVAQMVFAHLFELARHVKYHSDQVKKGRWTECEDFCFWDYPLVELSGLTMGIIGFGRIGQAVAKTAISLGMKVLAYDVFKSDNIDLEFQWAEIDELLEKSDVVSLHCPLFKETKGLINKDSLKKMKKTSFIINTSRGPLIVEEDLANALNNKEIAGAGLDVLSVEPPTMDNPLMTAQNCNITPHIAWATKAARARLMTIAANNIKEFIKGYPINVVNK